jgi:hypothetical protein
MNGRLAFRNGTRVVVFLLMLAAWIAITLREVVLTRVLLGLCIVAMPGFAVLYARYVRSDYGGDITLNPGRSVLIYCSVAAFVGSVLCAFAASGFSSTNAWIFVFSAIASIAVLMVSYLWYVRKVRLEDVNWGE